MSYWSERNSRGASAENSLESLQKEQLGWTVRGLCEVSALLFPLLSLLVDEKMIKEAPTLLTQDFFLFLFFLMKLCSTFQNHCGLFRVLPTIKVIPSVFNTGGGTLKLEGFD